MPYAVVLSQIPKRLTVGESVSWKWSDTDFPATSWTLTYTLINAGKQLQITATADGSDHLVEVTAGVSANYLPGDYEWQAHVDDGADERYQVGSGVITIDNDFAANAYGVDNRSHVKKVLDALEASIEGRASKTQVQQTVGGVQIAHISLEDQIRLRDKYHAKYQRELVRQGKATSKRTIKVRFR